MGQNLKVPAVPLFKMCLFIFSREMLLLNSDIKMLNSNIFSKYGKGCEIQKQRKWDSSI